MAGIDDRKIFPRDEVLWYPIGGYDTSTGSSELSRDLNAMNAASASLQRSIEGLDKRFKDLGFDPSSNNYSHILHPLLGFTGQSNVMEHYSDPLPITWRTTTDSQAPTNDNGISKIGIDATGTTFRLMVLGRPVIVTNEIIYVTEVDGVEIGRAHV